MPMAPPRACATCGQPGCQIHRRQAWHHPQPVDRIRGVRLQALRHDLFRAQPFCVHCGVAVATIRDHIVPLCDGGLDVASNTQALCAVCHDAKTTLESNRHRGVS
jgi:5-methylcytosine-specific restriction protein A